MPRSRPEWVGKTPDSRPPPTVRARVFLRADGVCHISKRRIRPGEAWDLEHVKPLHLAYLAVRVKLAELPLRFIAHLAGALGLAEVAA